MLSLNMLLPLVSINHHHWKASSGISFDRILLLSKQCRDKGSKLCNANCIKRKWKARGESTDMNKYLVYGSERPLKTLIQSETRYSTDKLHHCFKILP